MGNIKALGPAGQKLWPIINCITIIYFQKKVKKVKVMYFDTCHPPKRFFNKV